MKGCSLGYGSTVTPRAGALLSVQKHFMRRSSWMVLGPLQDPVYIPAGSQLRSVNTSAEMTLFKTED